MSGSNSKSCLRECIGQKVAGAFYHTEPNSHMLVFESGEAFVFNNTGGFWTVGREDVLGIIRKKKERLEGAVAELREIQFLESTLLGEQPLKNSELLAALDKALDEARENGKHV